MPILQIQGLSFEYPKKPVFQQVSLNIERGRLFTLLGPNGCGKTTLLHCILNSLIPSEGTVLLDGYKITEMKAQEIARKIAYVPQSHRKMFSYTVLDIVLMGRAAYSAFYSSPKKEDLIIAEEAISAVGMSDFIDKPFIHLSGGESQLVMLARAIAQQSEMILLDEPTAHLDSYHEMMVLDKLSELIRENGMTAIMTTHYPNQAFYFMNKGIRVEGALMKNGAIMLSGPGEEIFTQKAISELYQIRSKFIEIKDDEGGSIKQIIPFGLDNGRTE